MLQIFSSNRMHEAFFREMKNLSLKGRGLGHVTEFQILEPLIYLRNGQS